jgi:hypothetical protein
VTLPLALALTCLGIAALDLAVGFLVVLPRARPQAKTALTAAFVGNAMVLAVLAYAFGTGLLPAPGQPPSDSVELNLVPAAPGDPALPPVPPPAGP